PSDKSLKETGVLVRREGTCARFWIEFVILGESKLISGGVGNCALLFLILDLVIFCKSVKCGGVKP
ncbi:MAG: hypothetical protein P8Y45_16025, partial [Exilibacterium sp.]